MFKVMAERCNQCLYSQNKIVSDERRAEILRNVARMDSYFVCHKASIKGAVVCCAGDWETRGGGQLGRIADLLGAVEIVAEKDLAKHAMPYKPFGQTCDEEND